MTAGSTQRGASSRAQSDAPLPPRVSVESLLKKPPQPKLVWFWCVFECLCYTVSVVGVLSVVDRVAAARVLWEVELARVEQLPPAGDWVVWLYMAGRGAGKTRTAAEWLGWEAVRQPGTRWAVVAPTFSDARDVCVEGESGLLGVLERYGMLRAKNAWNRSIGELHLRNGSRVKCFSGAEPERFRGAQHHGAWVDELGAFEYEDSWDQLQFGLRLGRFPRSVVTTTPRPKPLIRRLLDRSDGSVVVTRGATMDNRANLAPAALAELLARYDGTRLGRQELYGELLEDVEDALWTSQIIDNNRVKQLPSNIVRTVVAVDPAVTGDGDETGIVVACRDSDGHGYVVADRSLQGTPDQWARRVVEVFDEFEADAVVVEVNQGGLMVAQTLRTVRSFLPIREVRATKGKRIRAEPISALYEQGRIHHVGAGFSALEAQLTSWTPDAKGSPDRLDALVWAFTELMGRSSAAEYLAAISKVCQKCQFPNRKDELVCVSCGGGLVA